MHRQYGVKLSFLNNLYKESHMIFNVIAYIILVVIGLFHMPLWEALLTAIIIIIISFILFLVLGLINSVIIQFIDNILLFLLKPFCNKNHFIVLSGKHPDWNLVLNGLLMTLTVTLLGTLLSVSAYYAALVFITLSMLVLISYIDRVFTKMPRNLIPVLIEALLFMSISLLLFNGSALA